MKDCCRSNRRRISKRRWKLTPRPRVQFPKAKILKPTSQSCLHRNPVCATQSFCAKFSGHPEVCRRWSCCSVRCTQRISYCAEDSELYSTTIRAYGRIPYPLAPVPNVSAAEFGRHAGRRMDDLCTNLRIEATKTAFKSEPKSLIDSRFLPGRN